MGRPSPKDQSRHVNRSMGEFIGEGSLTARCRRWTSWWAMSIFTGHVSTHAPHNDEANGSLPACLQAQQVRRRIEPIGPG